MLQNADILPMDEPTHHLDVINVAWAKKYLNSLTDVTAIIVSHDSGLLNDCCTNMMSIANLKLETFKGNLDELVKIKPSLRSFFVMTESKLKFKFPQPGPIDGVKSKGKALMKMSKCTFTYPVNDTPTLFDISHNNEFCSTLCPETWVMDSGHLETKGDAEWMLKQDTKIDDQQQLAEVTDAAGNVSKVKGQKKKLSKKEEKQMVKRIKAKLKNGEELDSDEEEFAINKDLI